MKRSAAWRTSVIATVFPLLIGCGRSATTPPSKESDPAAPLHLSGGERLTWTQAAPDVSTYRFFLYADSGTTRELGDAQCKRVDEGHFDCTATMPELPPGAHVLQIGATVLKDNRSTPGTRSDPFNVVIETKTGARPGR